MASTPAATPTSLKLPTGLKMKLEQFAQKAGMSLHAYMLETLSDAVQSAQQREAFALDSLAALREMKASGLGHELADVRAHFSAMAQFRKGLRARPPALQAKPLS